MQSFSFGGSAKPTGFSFGQPAATSAPATTTSTSNSLTGGGFSFGAKPTASVSASNVGGFSFGQPAQTQSQSSGFTFGQTSKPSAAAQPAQSASGGFSFGNSAAQTLTATTANTTPSQFSLSTPFTAIATTSQTVSQSAPSFGFGGSNLVGGSKPIGTTNQGLGSGFQLGAKPATSETPALKLSTPFGAPASQNLTSSAPPPASTSLNSGFSFGASKPAFSLGGATTTTNATTLQPTLGFPSQQSTVQSTQSSTAPTFGIGSKLGSTTTSAAPAPASGSFSLTGKISSATVTTASTTSTGLKFSLPVTTTTPASLGTTTGSVNVSSVATSSVSTTSSSVSAPALRYSDLEVKVNSWMNELEQQEKLFLTQATHVNAWGKLLLENADKITHLNTEFENVELNQKQLSEELDYIKTQQDELESLLQPLEENTKQQLASISSSVHTHHADIERERTYNLAENIDSQLKNMVQDLREVVDHINSTSTPTDSNNPIVQIGKILSAHMDSLQWLDSNSVTLENKVQAMTKQVDQMKKEQESKFRLAFN